MSNGSWTWSPRPEPGEPSGAPGQSMPPLATPGDWQAAPGATPQPGAPAAQGYGAGWSGGQTSRFGTPMAGGTGQFGMPPAGPLSPPPASAGPSGLVMWPLEPAPRRRRGLWIGVGLGVVALVGGLAAGWFLVGAKLIAPASPTAAVNRLVDGVQHKDGLSLLGSLSPAEVQPFRQMADQLAKNSSATPDPAATKAMLDAFGTLNVTVSGLQLKEETLDQGLAKVTFTAGTLTLDGDPQKIADAVVTAVGTHNPAIGSDPAALRKQVVDSLSGHLPYTVDLAHDWAANGKAPYLITVHEGHGWYVSPLMTLGEYLTESEGVQRGAMPRAADVAHPASPQEAANQLAAAIPALVNGDSGPLVAVLPEAERRFVAVYLQPALDASSAKGGPAPQLTLTAGDFQVTNQNGDHAWVTPTNLAYTLVMNGASGTVSYDGDCVAWGPDGSTPSRQCLSAFPLLGSLGLGNPALVAVHENGGWYVSLVGTLAEWTRTVGQNAARLQSEGKLDDPAWLQQQLPQGLTSSLAPAAGL